MSSNRREFLQKAAVTAGLGTFSLPVAAQRATTMPTARADVLMSFFGLKYPIFNAGMGGIANAELAIAVSNAGGLGAIGAGGVMADVLRQHVSRIASATRRPFAVNFLLAFDPVALPLVLDAGAPVIQFAWGIPTTENVSAVQTAGAKMGIQISSVAGARRALDVGADYLICQGTEAGGHVQATSALYEVLPSVIDEAKTVPVLAAGGIANGAQIRRALLTGASGVLIGTRFVATREAGAHEQYKTSIIGARASDTALTVCFHDGWESAPHRVLRNGTLQLWEAAGSPPRGKRPGEGDIVATNTITGAVRRRYSVLPPAQDDRGAVTELPMYAGQGVDGVRDIPSAGELVERLWQECLDAA